MTAEQEAQQILYGIRNGIGWEQRLGAAIAEKIREREQAAYDAAIAVAEHEMGPKSFTQSWRDCAEEIRDKLRQLKAKGGVT